LVFNELGLNLFDLRNSSTPFAEIEKYKNAQIIIKCIKIQIDYTVGAASQ